MEENLDPSPPPTTTADTFLPSTATLLRPRREPFEHGLLPISKLIFTDGTHTLARTRDRLLNRHVSSTGDPSAASPSLVGPDEISEALQISYDQACLVLDTLHAVHNKSVDLEEGKGADVFDLMLFLYIQSYKRLLPKAHKDSAAVADVWPSTSAFDGYLSALSPLQLVRSNSRRFMPSQADEEAHQLSYLQKHMANIVALLAEPVEGEGDESLVLTSARFEHLGFLIQFGERGEGISLSQAAPFFANSDPDMPAAHLPAAQVHEWLLQTIAVSLEHNAERASAKENGPITNSDQDVIMADASTSKPNNASSSRTQTFVEGFSKASVLRQGSEIDGHSVKVLNCHDSMIYVLAPLHYATVYGCSDATIVLGAIGKALRVEHCERVQVITATKRICIANCRECIFFLGVNQRPLIVGDNHNLQVAPYNTFYACLEEHMTQVGVNPTINRWDEPMVLGMVDPHDSLSHPAGVSDAQAESATRVDPDQFTNFMIPSWFGGESQQPTKYNPFPLPESYLTSQRKKHSILGDVQQAIRSLQLDESKRKELACALHLHFKEWLYASGNVRQLYCLQGD